MRRIHFEVTESTNTEARRLAAEYPGECLLVTAATQSAGRGRHGRAWESPRGGAWLSVVWPTRQPPLAYAAVSLVAAIAVRRALLEVVDTHRLQIKWPNDVLIDDRKVVGILCEQWPGESGDSGIVGDGHRHQCRFRSRAIAHRSATSGDHAQPRHRPCRARRSRDRRGGRATGSRLLEEFEDTGLNAELVEELARLPGLRGDGT